MDPSDAIQLMVLLLLLALSAFFSSAETAMTTVNKIRIQTMAEDGNREGCHLIKSGQRFRQDAERSFNRK